MEFSQELQNSVGLRFEISRDLNANYFRGNTFSRFGAPYLHRAVSCTSSRHLSIYRTQRRNDSSPSSLQPPKILSFCFHNAARWSETKPADLFLRGTAINSRDSSSTTKKFHDVVYLLINKVATCGRWDMDNLPRIFHLPRVPSKILVPSFHSRFLANSILALAAVAAAYLSIDGNY